MLAFIEGNLPVVVGTVAGLCSTVSFVPQVWKSWREGDTEAISKRMYVVTVSAFSLWIVYGLMIWSLPIIVFNALSLVLSGSVLVMKLRNLRRRRRADARVAGTP
ncbi:SemiSWEET family sugar transporter [Salinarimonas rosea]|uniref:SemiSWEET family sugar transporter n=1 Tax=Salinarimonas rosea TaxID=552063 RepID=UPI0004180888|nr:SemiSWEET transporter [Salinarimonas rosea]